MKKNLDSEFQYKIINDPIYGCIGLSEVEVKLLDTKAMQRLRRIRQMGFASYVFPSGEHSRFVHSLGVLCIMGKICEHLYKKYAKKGNPPLFSIEDVRHLRIAALLHDVGHFPFSHLSERVYSYLDSTTTNFLVSPPQDTNDETLLSEIGRFEKKNSQNHEQLGKKVIEKDPEISTILQKAHLDTKKITDAIIGDFSSTPLYAQLLHSNVDADRLDYLLRDSRQAGVCFGNIELNYIIQQMVIIEDKNKRKCLAFTEKSQHALEHFFMGRYFHYTQVVYHKTSMIFEVVAKALMYKALKTINNSYSSYQNIVDSIGRNDFYNFTDDFMWEYLRNFCEGKKDDFIQNLWTCLKNREKVKCINQFRCLLPKGIYKPDMPSDVSDYQDIRSTLKSSLHQIAQKIKISPENIGYVEGEINLTSIPKHLIIDEVSEQTDEIEDEMANAIRIIDKNEKVSFLGTDNKSLISKMINFTSNYMIIFSIKNLSDNQVKKINSLLEDERKKRKKSA